MTAPTPRTGNPTLRNGLLFGLLLGALGAGNTLFEWLTSAYYVATSTSNGFTSVNVTSSGPTSLLGCVLFLAILALTFVAGILTTRTTGKVGSGTLAGLLAGVVGGLIGGIVSVVVIGALVAPTLQAPADGPISDTDMRTIFIAGVGFSAILGLAVDAGFGAGMGALGGLIGANIYRRTHPVMQPAMYYPGYPMYPGFPMYPGYPSYPSMPVQPGSGPQQPWPYPPPPYPYPTAPSEQAPSPGPQPPQPPQPQ